MDKNQYKLYYNTEDIFLTPKINWGKLNENKVNPNIFKDFPVNEMVKFDQQLMIKAIQNGMIILIRYRGDKDEWRGGRERTICPMVIGRNTKTGNILIRGWHLDGWSVSMKKNTKKVWRLFKAVNVMGMLFTGDFFRLPPKGYKKNDRVMTEITYAAADFNTIRRNQFKLIQQGLIEDDEETQIEKNQSISIEIKNTDTKLDLNNIWANQFFNKKNQEYIKVTFLKSIVGGKYIAVLGAQGNKGGMVKFFVDRKLIGTYKVLESYPVNSGKFTQEIKNIKQIDRQSTWDLYTFVKKK